MFLGIDAGQVPGQVPDLRYFEVCWKCQLKYDRAHSKSYMYNVSTVELRWLELVRTVGASSTHPCVQAIPSLTIFKLVHVYFMSSRTPRFFDQSCKAHVTPVTDQYTFAR